MDREDKKYIDLGIIECDEENLLVANDTNKFDETLVYHGTDNDFDDFEEGRINWFTTDENYAKQYGQKILKRDIDTSDFIDIGEINQYLDYVDDDDYDKDGKLIVDYSNTFVPKCLKELADKIDVDVDELISIYNMEHLSEYEDEDGITFLANSLYDITNSLYFYNLLKEKNIKGIIASEGGITTYGVVDKSVINKLNESLHKATPYMLRNDGQVFECKGWHPYISNVYDNREDNLDSLINERLWELEWYYNNTLSENTKNLIRILINSCCNKQLNLTDEQKLKDMFNVSDDTYICRDDNELYSILENLNNETNQEFCKVRTSDIKFGGNSNDIYFRISSIGFNWFDLIWKFVMKNSNDISSVTISRDTRVRDFSQGECYKIKGKEINHMPTEEFLTLSGNPVLENYKCKLNIINKAIPKLKTGKSLNESYPNLHPKDINGFYNRQVKEELDWDINNILQPSDVHTIEDKGDYRLHTFKGEYSDQYVEEYKTLKGIMSRVMDNFINNKDYMTDDMTLYIEYKDGSTYYLGGSFDDGKFKKTGIKNVIIDDGTYAVYGDWIPRMEGGALYIETPLTNKGNEQVNEDLSQEVDSEGNPLSNEQVEFFKNSKVRDNQGRLLVCYHSTNKDFDVFKYATFFTPNKQFSLGYGNKIKECYLNLEKPFIIDYDKLWDFVEAHDNGEDYFENELDIVNEFGINTPDLYFTLLGAYDFSNDTSYYDVIDAVQGEGDYDGIILYNSMMNAGIDTQIITFYPNQIKSIDNKTPSSSDNINEDLTTDNYYRYEIFKDGKLVGGLFKGYVDIMSDLKEFFPSYTALFNDIGKEIPKPDVNYDGYDSDLIRSAFTEYGVKKFENALKTIKDEFTKNNIKLVKKKVNPDEDAIIYGDPYQIVYYDDMANVEPLD